MFHMMRIGKMVSILCVLGIILKRKISSDSDFKRPMSGECHRSQILKLSWDYNCMTDCGVTAFFGNSKYLKAQ